MGAKAYPKPNTLIANALEVLPVGGRAGLIHYQLPAQPKNAKFIAAIGVMCGFNNRIRCFSVFEKLQKIKESETPGAKEENERGD